MEDYEIISRLITDLLMPGQDERTVLARYRTAHPWDARSVGLAVEFLRGAAERGHIARDVCERAQREVRRWAEQPASASSRTAEPAHLEATADPTIEMEVPGATTEREGPATATRGPDLEAGHSAGDTVEIHVGDSDQSGEHAAPPLPPVPAATSRGTRQIALPPASSAARSDAAETSEELAESLVLGAGITLRGRYVLEEVVASGGMAIIYRALDLRREELDEQQSFVAIKVLRPELRDNAAAIRRFKHEFQCVQALSHPGIVRVFDLDCDAGIWFMTLEWMEGESLARRIERMDASLHSEEVWRIIEQCASALSYAHSRGVVHGDFKPGNVFLTADGDVRVIDWGLLDVATAQRMGSGAIDSPRTIAATPAYASPDILAACSPEPRDDVFSLACVAYELLSGTHPFERATSESWRLAGHRPRRIEGMPASSMAALERGLAWWREKRQATPLEFVAELDWRENAAVEAPQPEVAQRTELASSSTPEPEPQRRGPLLPVLIGSLVVALMGYVLLGAWRGDGLSVEVLQKAITGGGSFEETDVGADTAPDVRGSKGAAAVDQQAEASPRESTPAEASSAGSGTDEANEVPAERGDTAAPVVISFDTTEIHVSEAAPAAVLRLNRRNNLARRVRVGYRAVAGSAEAGSDFEGVSRGVADFADGQTMRAIFVPLVDDESIEPEEYFDVEITSVSEQGRIEPIDAARIVITDDD